MNFLFPFADKPHALAQMLRPIFPTLGEMLPTEDGQYVAFEWIGQENYLNEKISRNGKRTRGANFTSADAAVMFRRTDGTRQFVLIEWKYTEWYGGTSLKVAKSGTDRSDIYRPLFRRDDCPIDRNLLPGFDALFYEPFYQFMRQQFLAHEMERARELGASIVSVLHIAPADNTDFRKVTSPRLQALGTTAVDVWKRLVRQSDRFISVSTEQTIRQPLCRAVARNAVMARVCRREIPMGSVSGLTVVARAAPRGDHPATNVHSLRGEWVRD